jgi:PTS system nitrogen regulatory IIA component
MHFGSALRLLRIDAGFSLRALADRIGVSSAYLSRVENGHDPSPTPDRLIAIADVIGLPRSVLVELARQAGPAVAGYLQRTPEANALFLEVARRGLSGPQIARIKAFIDSEFPDPSADEDVPRLADLLPRSRIVLQLACSDWEDLISVAASRLGKGYEPRQVLSRVLAREKEAPTALGGGLAAPHAVIEGANDAAVLVTLARKLTFPTPDDRPVRAAILVVSGASNRTYLGLLARIARLASYDAVDELCEAQTPDKVRSIVERIESLW